MACCKASPREDEILLVKPPRVLSSPSPPKDIQMESFFDFVDRTVSPSSPKDVHQELFADVVDRALAHARELIVSKHAQQLQRERSVPTLPPNKPFSEITRESQLSAREKDQQSARESQQSYEHVKELKAGLELIHNKLQMFAEIQKSASHERPPCLSHEEKIQVCQSVQPPLSNINSSQLQQLRDMYREQTKIMKNTGSDLTASVVVSNRPSTFFVPLGSTSRLAKVVHSDVFNGVFSFFIVLNTMLLGVQANIEIENAMEGQMSIPTWFRPINVTLMGIFMIELILRFAAERLLFFLGEFWGWNLFDTFIVITALLEVCFEGVAGNFTFLRILKIARMFRAIRILRVFRYVRDLRIMICSVISSFVSLSWAFVLLAILIYCCAVTFCQGISDHLRTGHHISDFNRKRLNDFYRSVPISMYTLVLGISGGMDWHDLVSPLGDISPFLVGMFISYILFVVFGLLNVLTAVFVDRAHELANMDRDLVHQCQQYKMEIISAALKEIFQEADLDRSGLLSWKEFQKHCEKDSVRSYFESIELPVDHAQELFHVLDNEKAGCLSVEEFIAGCLRVKGLAGNLDILHVQQDVGKLKKLVLLVGDQIAALCEIIEVQFSPDPSRTQSSL